MAIDYARLTQAALASRSCLQAILPEAIEIGDEFVCGDLYGAGGKSFKLRLSGEKAGEWKDFHTLDGGKDITALIAAQEGISMGDAARKLADILGMELPSLGGKFTPARKKAPEKIPEKIEEDCLPPDDYIDFESCTPAPPKLEYKELPPASTYGEPARFSDTTIKMPMAISIAAMPWGATNRQAIQNQSCKGLLLMENSSRSACPKA